MLSNFNESDYRKWKKDNVTYRGVKEIGKVNNEYGADSLGQGLYSVPRSNISMARQYGKIYFLVNAKPKKPKVFNTLNDWEIWFQYNLLKDYDYNRGKFEKDSTIRAEMLKLGYDGVLIKGREMVNYTPENVLYFETENQLIQYYENNVI